VGGIITGYLSWNWAFLINVPVGIIAVIVATRYIPGRKKADERPVEAQEGGKRGFDFVGTVLIFAGLGLLIYGLNNGNKEGWLSPLVVVCLASATVVIALFIV
jgi:MFS family permease